jgi:diguanylate cyclase (GGDEF)-like protein/PAS domain S-box-containing protein
MNGKQASPEPPDVYAVLDQLPEPIFLLDPASLHIEAANVGASRLYARPRSELIGAVLFSLGPAVQFGEDALERARALVARVQSSGVPEQTEWIHEHLGGERFAVRLWVSLWTHQQRAYLRVVAFEITAHRACERRMRLFNQIFVEAQQGMVIADESGEPLLTNRAFHDITGLPEAITAVQYGTLFASPINPASALAQQQRDLEIHGHWKGQWWVRRADGRDVPVVLRITRVDGTPPEPTQYITVFTDISRILETEAQLDRMTYQDLMTGLANRRRARELLEARVAHEIPTALLHIGIDRFVDVNDGFGHQAGDEILKAVAQRLESAVRAADTVARVSGDGFMVIAPINAADEGAERLAERVLEVIRAPFRLGEQRVYLTASMGIGLFPAHGEDVHSLLQHAAAAKHRAKGEGGDRYALFTPTLVRLANRRLTMLDTLRRALEAGEIVPYFQPQVHAITHQVVGLEALARWEHPKEGTLAPARFLSLIEQSPLMETFTRRVLFAASKAVVAWRAAGLFHGRLAMNLSGGQIDTSTVPLVLDTISEAGLPPEALELEITETSIIHHAAEAAQLLTILQSRGITIAIDDFGTGYSSLQHLKVLPVDVLKLDRSFVMGLPDDSGDRTLSEAVTAMGRALGKQVVAEGVETDAQAAYLRALGCDVLQGYGIARPMSASKMGPWLRSWAEKHPRLGKHDTIPDD